MPPAGQLDVSSLDNETLAEMLESFGVNVGPITVATRRTYERRLIKLKTGAISPSGYQNQPLKGGDDNDEVDDEVDDDEDGDTQASYNMTKQRPAPFLSEPAWPQMRSQRDTELSSDRRYQYSLPSEKHSAFSLSTPYNRPAPKQRPEEDSKAIPLWLKLLALSISLTLIYLIYVNMEPPAVSSIPEINKAEV
jgi:hypothetical protein